MSLWLKGLSASNSASCHSWKPQNVLQHKAESVWCNSGFTVSSSQCTVVTLLVRVYLFTSWQEPAGVYGLNNVLDGAFKAPCMWFVVDYIILLLLRWRMFLPDGLVSGQSVWLPLGWEWVAAPSSLKREDGTQDWRQLGAVSMADVPDCCGKGEAELYSKALN